jgi:hypothetical protein
LASGVPAEKRQELESLKAQLRRYLVKPQDAQSNPRLVFQAAAAGGTREYVDAAVYKDTLMARVFRYIQRIYVRSRRR